LNILFLASRDLAGNIALNHLLPPLADTHSLRVFLSDAVGNSGTRPKPLQDLKFFEQTLFNELLFPLIDRAGLEGELFSFRGLERFTTAPVESLNQVNSEDSLQRLRAARPDLVISIRYGGIMREAAIAIPPLGVINLHSGALPAYRGVMATFRALLAGEAQLGTTIHFISDPGIDTGRVIARTQTAVQRDKSYLWHVLALYPPACKKLLACVADLAAGEQLPAQPQGEGGQYFSFPDQQDLENFFARGFSLIDPEEIVAIAQRYTGQDL
jgi:methionyl-tRNA formyltransferase